MNGAALEDVMYVECMLKDALRKKEKGFVDAREVEHALEVLERLSSKYKSEYFKSIHAGKK